jgi:predicted nucleic acid-binding protein
MIVLDTSVLVEGLSRSGRHREMLRMVLDRGERMLVPALVLYEWLRGPRIPEELAIQEVLFPSVTAIPFGPEEAAVAAEIYRSVRRPRQRDVDLAIAACTIAWGAELWTLNPKDFEDVPELRLYTIES